MLANLKLGAMIAVGLLVGYLLWREKYLADRNKVLAAQVTDLAASLKAERINTEKANESAQRYASRLAISRGPRSPPPVVMCRLPAAKAAVSTAAASPDGAAPPDDPGVLEDVDIGPLLDVPFRACEENWIKLTELQRWIRERE